MTNITTEEFIVNFPPYNKLEFGTDDKTRISDIVFYNGKLDCYCPKCLQESIFNGKNDDDYRRQRKSNIGLSDMPSPGTNHTAKLFPDGIYDLEFNCTRVAEHKLYVFFLVDSGTISKVGMSPSLFDVKHDESQKYTKLLDEHYKELRNALLLNANGFGVAAFTHLRRIVENFFLKQAHEQAKLETDWDETSFRSHRFAEKLKTLKRFLPDSLVGNAVIYGILSKGIHELSEKDCAVYFNAVKSCIFLALDDILNELKRKEAEKKITAELNKISQTITS